MRYVIYRLTFFVCDHKIMANIQITMSAVREWAASQSGNLSEVLVPLEYVFFSQKLFIIPSAFNWYAAMINAFRL